MTHSSDIVGYTYCADNYCLDCIRTMAAFALAAPGDAAFMGRPSDGDNTEQFLDRWAAREGVDREDEYSFDSDDFPKVLLAQMCEDTQDVQCPHCGTAPADADGHACAYCRGYEHRPRASVAPHDAAVCGECGEEL